MTKIIGRLKEVGIAKESSRGAGASPSFYLPKVNINLDNKVVKARTRASYGNIGMDGADALVAKEWAEGDLELDMHGKSFGLFLYALLGSVQTSGPSDSAYTHSFSLSNDNQHQSLALTIKESSLDTRMYKLAMINSLSIEITPEEAVKVTVNFMSKKGVSSSMTATYSADNKFIGRDLVFKIASDTSGLGAASNIPLKKLVLNFEKNTVLDHNLGTVGPQDILNQGFRVTAEIELDYQDRTYADLMSNGTYKAVRVQLTNMRNLIGVTSRDQFTLDLSRVDFDQWESAAPNDDIVRQTFTLTALYDVTNSDIIHACTLINAQASY